MRNRTQDVERRAGLTRAALIALAASTLFLGLALAPRATLQEAKPQAESFERYFRADEITRLVRDPRLNLVRVDVRSAADRVAAQRLGVLVEDYGSFVVIAAEPNRDFARAGLESLPLETSVNLPGSAFEPLLDFQEQTVRPSDGGPGVTAKDGRDYYVVQFAAPVRDEWLASLRYVGAEVLQYAPHQAFFVYADNEAIRKIAAQSRVRWVGRYVAENKIDANLREQIAAQLTNGRGKGRIQPLEVGDGLTAVFDVAVFSRARLDEAQAVLNSHAPAARIINVIKLPHNFFNVLRVELPLSEVERVAQWPDVVRIDPYYTPVAEDERAAQIVAGNYTGPTTISAPGYNPLAQFGVNGQGVTVSVVDDGVGIPGDGGFYVTAANTVNGLLYSAPAGALGHGHLNASIIAGDAPFSTLDPTGYNYGSGVAPKSHIINIPFLRSGYRPTGSELTTVNDTVTTVGPNGVKGSITNNSWGNGTNSNSYDSYAAQYDGYVQDASSAATIDPILIVFSAGNSGTSGLTRPKVAKNVIAVANSENVRPELFGTSSDNMEDMRSTSSRGLASDGRIKPDITAPGTGIAGGRSGTDSLSGNIDAFHRWSTGTSHAAPQIAGAAALFTQFWKARSSGQNPSPALAKAALLNATQEVTGFGAANPLPNGDEGWGRINMKRMFNTGTHIKYVDQTAAFSNAGESLTYTGRVADATKPVRITLVWTDPPGVGNPALVNNLDLNVTIGANAYKGNVFTAGTSTTGGSADIRNNVENVFVTSGAQAGTLITIQITATAINGNGIIGNADATDQHFALVAYNFAPQQGQPSDFDGDGESDVAVFRPSEGAWYALQSASGNVSARLFGLQTDSIVPADYDGDAKTDYAVYRPSEGAWYILESMTGTMRSYQFGISTDAPRPADYDGDGRADVAVFRPSTGAWYILRSSDNSVAGQFFGLSTDRPVNADYDGDGKADLAFYRPSEGAWYVLRSSTGTLSVQAFGLAADVPVAADYDGDAKADIAVFRPSEGAWYILQSSNNGFRAQAFGLSTDMPVPGDYDRDGRVDIAVFREGAWYILRSTDGTVRAQVFGTSGDRAIAGAFIQ